MEQAIDDNHREGRGARGADPEPADPTATGVLGTHLSVTDVARGTGLSVAHVSRAKEGKRGVSTGALERIAEFCGLTFEEAWRRMKALQRANLKEGKLEPRPLRKKSRHQRSRVKR
jgi:transcriptional regulator with XRE-family HTH domain